MAFDLFIYGSLKPVRFKIALNGVGVAPTLDAEDVQLFIDDVYVANIGGTIASVSGYLGMVTGMHLWTPTGTQTQGDVIQLNIKDYDGGGAFDENLITLQCGGNPSDGFFTG